MWDPDKEDDPKAVRPIEYAEMLPRKGWEKSLAVLRYYEEVYNETLQKYEWFRRHALLLVFPTCIF